MREDFVIVLEGRRREDGSWFISSPDLPMFSVTGSSQKEALDNAISIIPTLLEKNYGASEDIKQIPALRGFKESDSSDRLLPAYVVAAVERATDGSRGSPSNS
jgi:predicted RNase H-like HicB family nuclease